MLINKAQILYFSLYSDDKGKSRLIREEDHDRSDDEDSQDRLDMTVNTEARDKEKRREAFLASQAPIKCKSLLKIANLKCNIFLLFFKFVSASKERYLCEKTVMSKICFCF